MSARSQAIAGLVVSLVLLSGCAVQEPQDMGNPPRPTQILEEPRAKDLDVIAEEPVEETRPADSESPAPLESRDSKPEPEPVEAAEPSLAAEEENPVKVDGPTIAQIAYSQAFENADGSAIASEEVVVASPILPDLNRAGLVRVTSAAMSFFDHDYGIPAGYKIIAFTDEDLPWANQKLAEYGGMLPPGFSSWESWVSSNPYMKADECWMSVNSFGATHFCMAVKESVAKQQINTIAHEYVHNVQTKQLGLDTTRTPSWITEGGAEYLGFVIVNWGSSYALNNLARWQTQYLSENYGGFGWQDYIFSMTREDFVIAMKAIELSSVDPMAEQGNRRYGMYPLGAVANEYLVGNYSYDTYMSYIMNIGKGGQDWSTAFQNVFKLTPNQFYSELYDYLRQAYS